MTFLRLAMFVTFAWNRLPFPAPLPFNNSDMLKFTNIYIIFNIVQY